MSFPAPHENQFLFGHSTVLKRLNEMARADKLPQAMIFLGPEGIGKTTAAISFIRDLIGIENPERTSKQIAALSHPNLCLVMPIYDEKKQKYARDITLDALKKIHDFLRLAAVDDVPRFVVITPADSLNRNAQNALLKMLEEPPAKVSFILIASQLGRFLPTIRSRCIVQNFTSLEWDEFASGLSHFLPELSLGEQQAQFTLAQGALGQALQWHEQEILDHYADLIRAMAEAIETKDALLPMRTAESLAQSGEGIAGIVVQLLLDRLSLFITRSAQGQGMATIIPEEGPLFIHWQKTPIPGLLQRHETLTNLWAQAELRYLDHKQVLLQFFNAVVA